MRLPLASASKQSPQARTSTLPVQVRTAFDWQSLEVWVVGQIQAFHLHVPKLWGRILPGKCGIKVNVRTKKLFVCLYKETDAEWRYLKGF